MIPSVLTIGHSKIMTYTSQQLREYYKKLPADIKEVVGSSELSEKIIQLGETHHLHIDKVGQLSDEVGLTLLGLTKPDDFVKNIATRLKIDQPTAEAITAEINQAIFLPIRESLQEAAAARRNGSSNGNGAPSAEQVLREIENPVPAQVNIFEQKMSQMFDLARGAEPVLPEEKLKHRDPYLEPIE